MKIYQALLSSSVAITIIFMMIPGSLQNIIKFTDLLNEMIFVLFVFIVLLYNINIQILTIS
jgi:hypothetical protein